LVLFVRDAVLVVVRIRGSRLRLGSRLCLPARRAFVARVRDAVAVAVAVFVDFGAAVFVVIAVEVLGTFGQRSFTSKMPSLSLSGSGQPSSSLKPSKILRLVRALILIVFVAVAVAVADRRLVHEAEHEALIRGLKTFGDGAATCAEHQIAVVFDEELDTAEELFTQLCLEFDLPPSSYEA